VANSGKICGAVKLTVVSHKLTARIGAETRSKMVDIQVTDQEHVTLVEVSGRVDSMNADQLGTALSAQIDEGNNKLVLDLANVEYMSSAGLRELVSALKKAKKAEGDMRISQPSNRVREVLEMAGLDTVILIFDSQVDAVNSY
jgi:anti-sigma B factor antagonist